MTQQNPITSGNDKTVLELIGSVLTKTFYGHWVGKILALSLALEQAIDLAAADAIARQGDWRRDIFLDDAWARVSIDRKHDVLRKIMLRYGGEKVAVGETIAAMKQVANIRNIVAHSSLSENIATAKGGLLFDSYRRGKGRSHELTQQEIEDAITAGVGALNIVVDLRTVIRNESDPRGRAAANG